jgi:hypothetical protein
MAARGWKDSGDDPGIRGTLSERYMCSIYAFVEWRLYVLTFLNVLDQTVSTHKNNEASHG